MGDRDGSIYEKLGVRRVINAQGHRTIQGGSTPSQAVVKAMDEASSSYVGMEELLERSGDYIAHLLGAEAAHVTSGCHAALVLSTAACMASSDLDKVSRLPDTTGMKSDFLLQKRQRYGYDRAFSVCGGRLVEVGDEDSCTLAQLEQAVGPNTAAIAYLVQPYPDDSVVQLADVVELAHSRGLPVIADAAAQVYPLDYLFGSARSADLVCFGGKYFGAPQSTGFLCGKKELVEAAAANGFMGFHRDGGQAIGRGMKVDRQEIVGLVAAIDTWLTMDHEDRVAGYEAKLSTIERGLRGIVGISASIVDVKEYWQVSLRVEVDSGALGKTADEVAGELDSGNPRVGVLVEIPDTITVNAQALDDGDEEIVAERLRAVLGG